jgi:alkaline phosphatase D
MLAGAMPTILQLSDAHLSPRNGLFRGNLALLRQAAERIRPDLVVASGDLSLDGADRDGDLELAAELHRAFPGRVLLLPGNHDTGSHLATMPDQPVEAARLARWQRVCGPDRFLADLPGWRVVGLNTEIMAWRRRRSRPASSPRLPRALATGASPSSCTSRSS